MARFMFAAFERALFGHFTDGLDFTAQALLRIFQLQKFERLKQASRPEFSYGIIFVAKSNLQM